MNVNVQIILVPILAGASYTPDMSGFTTFFTDGTNLYLKDYLGNITQPTGGSTTPSLTGYALTTTVAAISAGIETQVVQLSGYVQQHTNSLNTLFSTYSNSTTVAAISAGLQNQISTISVPTISGYVLTTTVAAISAGIETQVVQLSGYTQQNTNGLNSLFSTYANSATVAAISAGLQTEVVQLSGYVQQHNNSLNTLFSTYATTAAVSAISGGIETQVIQLSGYVNVLTTSTGAISANVNTLFNTYANSITVAAISAGLNTQIAINTAVDVTQQNSLNTLFSNFTNTTTTAAISAGLQTQLSAINTTSIQTLINQNLHGFSVGQAVYFNSAFWSLAAADNVGDAEAIGLISAVPDVNHFVLVQVGFITITTATFTPGNVYFLSPTTAGSLVATEPTVSGQVSKPMLIAVSATTGYVYNMRGVLLNLNTVITSEGTQSITGNKTFTGTVSFTGEITKQIFVVNTPGTYNVAVTDYTIIADTTSGNITVLLPFTPDNGRVLNIKKATIGSGNTLTIDPNGGSIDRIAGAITLADLESRTLQYSTTPINTWYEL